MIFDDSVYKSVDYQLVYQKANEILVVSETINTFPFKVSALLKEMSDVRLCSYAKAADKYMLSMKSFGSESAIIMEQDGAYIIFYNQAEKASRVRFSIMHEFGHYILQHRFDLDRNDPLYAKQEMEANCFASQVLAPEQILRECEKRGKRISVDYISTSFEVSNEAAGKRRKTLAGTNAEWKSRAEREYDDIILLKYASLINKIAPVNHSLYFFEEEYERQRERDTWYGDSRSRW